MPYNSNTLFQKMPDKVSFFYAQISKKWLELSLKKFSSYIFKNNGESETVLYLTNGRKTEAEGTAEKVASKAKEVAEDAKEAVEGAIKGVKNIFHKDDK